MKNIVKGFLTLLGIWFVLSFLNLISSDFREFTMSVLNVFIKSLGSLWQIVRC